MKNNEREQHVKENVFKALKVVTQMWGDEYLEPIVEHLNLSYLDFCLLD